MGSTIIHLSFLLLTTMVIHSVNSYPRNHRESRTLSSSPFSGALSGVPGKDFPILEFVPVTGFNCVKHMPGYFADMEARCQVFHICQDDGRHDAFLCPNGTLFNQQYFVCDWWYNVDCQASGSHYYLNKIFRQQDSSVNAFEPEDYAQLGSHASTSTVSKTKDEKSMNKKVGSPAAITATSINLDSTKKTGQQTVSNNATREQPSPNKAASSSSVSKVTISTTTSGAKQPSSSKKNTTKVDATKKPSSSSYSDQAQGGSTGTEYFDSTENPTTILPSSDDTEENLIGTTEQNSISEQLTMIPALTGLVDSILPETSNYDTALLDSTTTELPLKQESTAAPLSAEIGTFNTNSSTSIISTDTVLPYVEGAYPSDQEYLSAVMTTTVQPESAEVQANVVTEPSTSSERVVTSTTALPGSSSTESASSSVGPLIQLESLTLRPEVATEYFPLTTEEELGSGSSATTALPLDDSTVTSAKTDVLAPTPSPAAMTVQPHKEATITQATSTGTVTMMPGSYYANKSPSSVGGLYSQVVTETVPKNNHSNTTIAIASSSSPTTTVTQTLINAATVQNGSTTPPSISNRPTTEQNNKSPAQYNDKIKPSKDPKPPASSSYGSKSNTKTVSAKAIKN